MADLNKTIGVGVDASGAEAGLTKAKTGFRELGEEASKASEKIDGATKKNERAVNRTTENMIRAIERQIARTESAGKSASEYYRKLGEQRGVDTSRLDPFLKKLQEIEGAQRRVGEGNYKYGISRLPFQFATMWREISMEDMNPMRVMTVHVNQIGESFGGFGKLMKGIGGMLTPARVALGGLGSTGLLLAAALYEASKRSKEFENAITLSGGAAGVTATQLLTMHEALISAGNDVKSSAEILTLLASSGKVAGSNMLQVGAAIASMHKATGREVKDLAQDYIEIGIDPVHSIQKLNDSVGLLSSSTYLHARALEEEGRHQEAVALVQDEYARKSKEMSDKASKNIDVIAQAWRSVKEATGAAIASMDHGINRMFGNVPDTERIRELQEQIAAASGPGGGSAYSSRQDPGGFHRLSVMRAELQALLQRQALERASAQEQAKRAEEYRAGTKAAWALYDGQNNALTKQQSLAKKLAEIERDRLAALRAARTETDRQTFNMQARVAKEKAIRDSNGALDVTGIRKAILYAEGGSVGNSHPSGGAGSQNVYGVGQMMWSTAKQMASEMGMPLTFVKFTTDLNTQIALVDQYIRHISKYLGTTDRYAIAAAYNAGPGYVHGAMDRVGLGGDFWGAFQTDRRSAASHRQSAQYRAKIAQMSPLDSAGNYIDTGWDYQQSPYEKWAMKARDDMDLAEKKRDMLMRGDDPEKHPNLLRLWASDEWTGMGEHQRSSATRLAEQQDRIAAQNDEIIANNQKVSQQQQAFWDSLQQENDDLEKQGRDMDEQIRLARTGGKFDKNKEPEFIMRENAGRARDLAATMIDGSAEQEELLRKAQNIEALIVKTKQLKTAQDAYNADWQMGAATGVHSYITTIEDLNKAAETSVNGAFTSMQNTLGDFIVKGKADWRGMVISMLSDFSKLELQMALVAAEKSLTSGYSGSGGILGWFVNAITGRASGGSGVPSFNLTTGFDALNALGGVYSSPSLSSYSNQIVSSPTVFAFAKGSTGLMGEAGPEAILPLKRGADGALGIRASGTGAAPQVNLTVNAATVSTQASTAGDDTANYAKFGAIMASVARQTILNEQRPGGSLSSTFGI